MKRHERFEPMEYRHELLMDELNEFMMDIKTHLFAIPINRPKPTVQEIDLMMHRLMAALRKDSRPMIRR